MECKTSIHSSCKYDECCCAFIGVDSCPIEGFEKENVEKVLELDTSKFQVALMLPFGYRLNDQPKQLRSDFASVVEFIK